MANAAQINSDLAAIEMTWVADMIVKAGRNSGSPLKYFTNVSGEIGAKGVAVAVPIAPTLSSGLVTEGAANTLDNTAPTTATVTLNKIRKYSFAQGTVAQAIAGQLAVEYQMQAGVAGFLNDVEADCLSAITSGITTNTAGTYNAAITTASIQAACAALDDVKAPASPRIGLLRHGSKAWDALTALITWTNTGTQSPLVKNNDGGIFYNDVVWYKTQALPKNTNNTDNVVLTPGSIAIAMRPLAEPVAGALCKTVVDADSGLAFQIVAGYDINKGVNVYNIQMLYGFGILKESYAALLKS